eukprot:comp22365_c0_seq1/m.54137 comp22365_c0_seq1/g.54137  ORF comp22365_c0_seq1/g.54137 comp22365_c0_seq1/m.54137 type:complete len:383 (+) comp22365_c0_seq1:186-1334(+)
MIVAHVPVWFQGELQHEEDHKHGKHRRHLERRQGVEEQRHHDKPDFFKHRHTLPENQAGRVVGKERSVARIEDREPNVPAVVVQEDHQGDRNRNHIDHKQRDRNAKELVPPGLIARELRRGIEGKDPVALARAVKVVQNPLRHEQIAQRERQNHSVDHRVVHAANVEWDLHSRKEPGLLLRQCLWIHLGAVARKDARLNPSKGPRKTKEHKEEHRDRHAENPLHLVPKACDDAFNAKRINAQRERGADHPHHLQNRIVPANINAADKREHLELKDHDAQRPAGAAHARIADDAQCNQHHNDANKEEQCKQEIRERLVGTMLAHTRGHVVSLFARGTEPVRVRILAGCRGVALASGTPDSRALEHDKGILGRGPVSRDRARSN